MAIAAAQRLAAADGKKKRSRSRRNSNNNDDNDGDDGPSKSQKQHRKPKRFTAAPPAMSAVAARKLALMKEQEEASKNGQRNEEEQEQDGANDARIYTEAAPSQDDVTGPTESEDKQEISALNDILDDEGDDGDDGNDSDNMLPIASTSKKPAEKRSKRYFSANAQASAEVTETGSDPETEIADDTAGPNTSYSEPSTPLRPRKRAKRRRRGDDHRNAYFDPDCVSSWKPVHQQNCFSVKHPYDSAQKSYIVAMQPGETLMTKGIASLRILRGSVNIDCGVLDTTSQPFTLFAPTTHPLPVLRASYAQASSSAPSTKLHLPDGLAFSEVLEAYPVVMLIQDVQTGIEGIEAVAKVAGMPVPINGFWTSQFTGPQTISGSTFELITQPERDITATLLPDNWMEALSTIDGNAAEDSSGMEEGDTYIVQGPKGVGKSTFAKMLVNRLLSTHHTVAYLECDIGQTELTPPGLVSLHLLSQPIIGPAFTQIYRLHQSARSHYLGSVSPKNNPSYYLASIQDLLAHYGQLRDNADAALPLVINTQGWVKGLGADLLGEIYRMAIPSRIFDFSPPSADPSYPSHDAEPSSTPTTILQPMSQPADYGPTRLNASDLRTLSLISYLHLESQRDTASTPRWNFSRSLVAQTPFAVPWSTFKQIRLLSSEHIVYEELLNALDVSIVSLESLDDPQIPGSEQALAYDPHSSTRTTSGTCLGLGVIRAIDKPASAFHILSNLPSDQLDRVNSISKGDIELPTALMIDYIDAPDDQEGVCGVPWKDVPYLESREDQQAGVGYSKRRIRRNVMRRSQFR